MGWRLVACDTHSRQSWRYRRLSAVAVSPESTSDQDTYLKEHRRLQMKADAQIESATRALRKPAGDDVAFSTPQSIAANRHDYVVRCHDTWKYWHEVATRNIVIFEGLSEAEKAKPIGPPAEEYAAYNRAVWRRVNDTIVWTLLGCQRHRVKPLCLYRERPSLLKSNPHSVRSYLEEINSKPLSLGIWNDATSCIDVGDVTLIENGLQPLPKFVELKEGPVNAEIVELLKLEGAERKVKLSEFTAKHAKAGVDQLNRVIRQKETGQQAIDLLVNEQGVDPITKLDKRILEVGDLETYDPALNDLLTDALVSEQEHIELLSECVWVYVNASPQSNRIEVANRFNELLRQRVPTRATLDTSRLPRWDRDTPFPLNHHFFHPMSCPLFLRGIEPNIVAEITSGRLMYRVWMYLDWGRYSEVIASCGAHLAWGSKKQIGRTRSMNPRLRPPIFSGRLPLIEIGHVKLGFTDPNLVQVLFDGVTPRTMAMAMMVAAQQR